MAKTTVEVEIVAILREAKKQVADFAKSTQNSLDGLNMKASITALNQGFELVERTAGRAFAVVKDVMSEAIAEAIQGEEAMTKLSNSMRLVGDFSGAAAADMKAFADEMQRTTVNSDDAVLSALAVAKNFNLTNKEAQAATKAAADFAAATGTDLDSAVSKVARTFNGLVDKELARYLPAIKGLSKEQLVLGDAARIVGDRFRGFAAALGDTFNGSLQKTRNAMADLLESVGELIIQNPVLIGSVQILGEAFGALKGEVEGNKSALSVFISESVKTLASFAPQLIKFIKLIDGVASAVINLFRALGTFYGGVAAAIQAAAQGNFAGAKDVVESTFKDILNIYGDTKKRLDGFYDPLIKSAEDASRKIQALGLEPNKKGKLEITVNKSDAQILGERMKNALVEGADVLKKRLQEAFDKQKQFVSDVAANPFKSFIPSAGPGENNSGLSNEAQGYVAAGAGFVTAALSGVEGARTVIASFAGAVADYFIPGLGSVVSELVKQLSYGPEYVKKMVTEFESAVPDLVSNILESIPALIEQVANNVPMVINKIVDAIPRVIQAFIRGIPNIIAALIRSVPEIVKALIKAFFSLDAEGVNALIDIFTKGLPDIIKAFIDLFVKGIPDIIEGFYKGFVGAAGGIAEAIINAITDVGGSLFGNGENNGGVFGGIGDFFGNIGSGIGDFFGLASGGTVPDVPAYRGDRFGPVMLDGGEEVLDQTTGNQLRAALADGSLGGGNQKMPDIVINIGLQQFARIMFDARRAGYQV